MELRIENLKKISSFFQTYHKKIGGIQLTKFSYLTEDKLVQQTQFGEIATATVNFSNRLYNSIPANSIQIYYIKENKKEIVKELLEKVTEKYNWKITDKWQIH